MISTKKTILGGLILLAVAGIAGAIYYFKHPVSGDGHKMLRPVSLIEAKAIARKCEADGTFEYHSGLMGLVLKGTVLQPVKDTTAQELRELENPSCPFTVGIIE